MSHLQYLWKIICCPMLFNIANSSIISQFILNVLFISTSTNFQNFLTRLQSFHICMKCLLSLQPLRQSLDKFLFILANLTGFSGHFTGFPAILIHCVSSILINISLEGTDSTVPHFL
uniref:Uncharacterized protein n=1 Tax=Salvator merianae TaxID=96440 RepID=A0A8D0BZC2_SALMN